MFTQKRRNLAFPRARLWVASRWRSISVRPSLEIPRRRRSTRLGVSSESVRMAYAALLTSTFSM